MTTTIQTKLAPRVNARLSAYATLAGVALTVPVLASSADAAVVYSGPVSINVPSTTSGVYINVVTGTIGTSGTATTGWDFNPWGSGSLFLYGNGTGNGVLNNFTGGSSATLGDNLPIGTPVGPTFTFGNGGAEITGLTAFTLNSSSNYAGFRFTNEATGAVNYGWAQLSLSSTYNGQPRTVLGYAYENTGLAIAAGVVPEPGTTAMLGLGALSLGAAGVRRWRKAKQVA